MKLIKTSFFTEQCTVETKTFFYGEGRGGGGKLTQDCEEVSLEKARREVKPRLLLRMFQAGPVNPEREGGREGRVVQRLPTFSNTSLLMETSQISLRPR